MVTIERLEYIIAAAHKALAKGREGDAMRILDRHIYGPIDDDGSNDVTRAKQRARTPEDSDV